MSFQKRIRSKRLRREFFNRATIKVAKELLGKYIVRVMGGKKIIGKIVETEAYVGVDDLACHASCGRTPRTETLFGLPGIAYIYLIYGMYYCFNVVTEKKEFPAAVLIRAVEPRLRIKEKLASGPGKLCQYFKIDKSLNAEDLTVSKELWIEDQGEKVKPGQIIFKERVGVDYAKHCANYPWRFYLKDNIFVSKK